MAKEIFPRRVLLRLAQISEADRAELRGLRLDHTRLGFAYQLAFIRLTGRLPRQKPLEIAEDLLVYVAQQLGFGDDASSLMTRYASRQPTISEHTERAKIYLGVRPFEAKDREALSVFVRKEAEHLEQVAGLVAASEEYLRRHKVLLPATSTIRRVVGEERATVRRRIFDRVSGLLSDQIRAALDKLLVVQTSQPGARGASALQTLKEPPGPASPRSLLREIEKLDAIATTGALEVDLSWLRSALKKALAHRVRHSTAHRLRHLEPSHRYAAMLCFLQETHGDTVDQIVDLHAKVMTQTYRRAKNRLDKEYHQHRRSLVSKLSSLKTIGELVLNPGIPDEALRAEVLARVPRDRLEAQVDETTRWLSDKSDVFPRVADRFKYFRKYSPHLLEHLHLEPEPATPSPETSALMDSVDMLRNLNAQRKRAVPEDAPTAFIPKGNRPFVETDGGINRAAYECAVLTALRDEIRRGNVAVQGSKRFGRVDDLFMPSSRWEEERERFFARADLPAAAAEGAEFVRSSLERAYDRFLSDLPGNAYVQLDEEKGWRFGTNPAEAVTSEHQTRLDQLTGYLERRIQKIRLPDLLIQVDNEVQFTRHLLRDPRGRSREQVCQAIATVMAYGCNLGPETMARLTPGVTYSQIKRIADWHLHEDVLRPALADIVNAISGLTTASAWGEARTASSDGQRFLFPRRAAKRTYSHRMGDYALEFYSFIADNYAPFYSVPIECSERDAAYVLDGLLYHEADLEIDTHYVDTHGYTEANFTGFAMLGKKFAPRIRGLHRQRIYHADPKRDYGPLQAMLRSNDRKLHLRWIEEQWDRMGHFFCSMATGYTTASVAMKRIVAFGPKNHLYGAIRELGRAFKTLFILEYLGQPDLRRRVRRGLLKSEELHALARSVFYGKLGKADWRDFRRQMSTASCLLIILASIVYWQIREIERVLGKIEPGEDVPVDLLAHISPISWENIVLYGEYKLRPELVAVGRG